MKEKIKFIILLILFVVCLFAINQLLDKQNQDMITNEISQKEQEDTVKNSEVTESNNEENNIENIKYIKENEFEEEVLKEEQTVLVDFYADWCQPCKYLSPILEEFAKDNPDIKIVKVDVDEAMKISYEYSATSIPTLVVFKDGKEVNRSVGVISQEEIKKLVK